MGPSRFVDRSRQDVVNSKHFQLWLEYSSCPWIPRAVLMRWLSAKGVLPVGLSAVYGVFNPSKDRSKTGEDFESRGGGVSIGMFPLVKSSRMMILYPDPSPSCLRVFLAVSICALPLVKSSRTCIVHRIQTCLCSVP